VSKDSSVRDIHKKVKQKNLFFFRFWFLGFESLNVGSHSRQKMEN